jgi:alpha-tubulin suppressor-like RCC1 family protein
MDNVKSVSAWLNYTMILKTDNSLWATGWNFNGQFGNGTNSSTDVPVKIMDNVKSVSTVPEHVLVNKTDNSLWVAGRNDHG